MQVSIAGLKVTSDSSTKMYTKNKKPTLIKGRKGKQSNDWEKKDEEIFQYG